MTRTLARLAAATLALAAGALGAEALDDRALLCLPLEAEERGGPEGTRAFGTVGSYLQALKRAGRQCRASSYAYGGSIVCQTGDPERPILIDLAAQPTRSPDRALVTAIRPEGRNSTELPQAEMPGFLANLAGRRAAP